MEQLETKRPKRKTERSRRALELETVEVFEEVETVSLDQAMNEFIIAKSAERAAPRTISDYKTHFKYLLKWLDEHHPGTTLRKITSAVLFEYVNWMTHEKSVNEDHPSKRTKPGLRGLSTMTVNVRIRTLKAFFRWCEGQELVAQSPAADIKLQKVDEDKIHSFTVEQLKTLLAAPDRNTFSGFRDYVIMMTLVDTGLRITELLSLTLKDVDLKEFRITVPWGVAKTRKMRQVPISLRVAKLLAELQRENEDFGPNINHFFYSSYGRVLSPDGFDERLKIYAKDARVEDVRVSAHSFRHTFALHWIKQGGDPFSLQKILGHSDMSMVRKYVRLSEGDVKEKHQQFSPVQTLMS